MTAKCLNCGGELPPNANFCRFCGSKQKGPSGETSTSERTSLYSEPVIASSTSGASLESSETEKKELGSPEELQEELEKFIPILYARTRKTEIEKSLRKTMESLETISTKLELGLISGGEAKESVSQTKELIAKLKEERKDLPSGELPIETLSPEAKEAEEKLDRLHEMRKAGRIERENVYEQLVVEYEAKKREIDAKIEYEKRKMTVWVTMLEEDLETATDQLSSLKVRHELGEVTSEEIDKRKQLIEENLAMKNVALKSLKTELT